MAAGTPYVLDSGSYLLASAFSISKASIHTSTSLSKGPQPLVDHQTNLQSKAGHATLRYIQSLYTDHCLGTQP